MNLHKTDWDKYRIFYFVAESGGFTKASRVINIAQPSLTRTVAYLEHRLKTKLFIRTPRGVVMTERGSELFRVVRSVYSKLFEYEETLQDHAQKGQGFLKVSVPLLMPSLRFSKVMPKFVKRHPNIKLHFTTQAQDNELTTGDIDIAVRFDPSENTSLTQVLLTQCSLSLYASRDYVKQQGKPSCVEELSNHSLIAYSDSVTSCCESFKGIFRSSGSEEMSFHPMLRLNSLTEMIEAGEGGLGIVLLPEESAQTSKLLVPLLPSLSLPPVSLYYVSSLSNERCKRVNAYKESLLEEFQGVDSSSRTEEVRLTGHHFGVREKEITTAESIAV